MVPDATKTLYLAVHSIGTLIFIFKSILSAPSALAWGYAPPPLSKIPGSAAADRGQLSYMDIDKSIRGN